MQGTSSEARERDVVLTPFRPRVVGPGRRERTYLASLAERERALVAARADAERLARELELAERVERGTQRRMDRLEGEVAREREATQRSEEAQKRLLLALGAVQRENELLRQRVAALAAPAALRLKAPEPAPRGWRRLFTRARAPRA